VTGFTIVNEVASTWELHKCWFIRCVLSGTGSAGATCGCGLGLDTRGLVNITTTRTTDFETKTLERYHNRTLPQCNLPSSTADITTAVTKKINSKRTAIVATLVGTNIKNAGRFWAINDWVINKQQRCVSNQDHFCEMKTKTGEQLHCLHPDVLAAPER